MEQLQNNTKLLGTVLLYHSQNVQIGNLFDSYDYVKNLETAFTKNETTENVILN